MPVPLLNLGKQNAPLLPQMQQLFEHAVTSSGFVLGPQVEAFERDLAVFCGSRHAVGVSSGTDALLMALMALGIGPGDEVITSPFTFIATASCIIRIGATPVFVDIDPATFNIAPSKIEAAITAHTKAVIPVHLYGQMADMAPIMRTAKAHNLKVIEDAAQAIGAGDGPGRAGSIGDVGCLSFYPTKNLSALGDAGACTVNDPALASRLISLRVHGQEGRYRHTSIGGNFRIDALQAAVLGLKLQHLSGWTEARRALALRYAMLLGDTPLVLPTEGASKYHVYNQYTVRVPNDHREALREHLRKREIGHEVYYPTPLHLQPCFGELDIKAGDLPIAEQAANEVLSLPIDPCLTQPQQDEVAAAVCEFFA